MHMHSISTWCVRHYISCPQPIFWKREQPDFNFLKIHKFQFWQNWKKSGRKVEENLPVFQFWPSKVEKWKIFFHFCSTFPPVLPKLEFVLFSRSANVAWWRPLEGYRIVMFQLILQGSHDHVPTLSDTPSCYSAPLVITLSHLSITPLSPIIS